MRIPRALLVLPVLLPVCIAPLPVASVASAAVEPTGRLGAVHHIDVDGDGTPDRVAIRAGRDLEVTDGSGSGHYRVRVHLSRSDRVVHRRLEATYYYSTHDEWSPWYGATDLDRKHGKELVLGITSGAHTSFLAALSLRHGELRRLGAPRARNWVLNSSVGTGSQGWKCTRHGVRFRSVAPKGDLPPTTYHVTRTSYVRHAGMWQRTHHVEYDADADAHGNPPHNTYGYASFACRGMPDGF